MKIKKGEEYLIDCDKAHPLEVRVMEIFDTTTRDWLFRKKSVRIIFAEGKKYFGGLKEEVFYFRYQEKAFKNKVIKKIK